MIFRILFLITIGSCTFSKPTDEAISAKAYQLYLTSERQGNPRDSGHNWYYAKSILFDAAWEEFQEAHEKANTKLEVIYEDDLEKVVLDLQNKLEETEEKVQQMESIKSYLQEENTRLYNEMKPQEGEKDMLDMAIEIHSLQQELSNAEMENTEWREKQNEMQAETERLQSLSTVREKKLREEVDELKKELEERNEVMMTLGDTREDVATVVLKLREGLDYLRKKNQEVLMDEVETTQSTSSVEQEETTQSTSSDIVEQEQTTENILVSQEKEEISEFLDNYEDCVAAGEKLIPSASELHVIRQETPNTPSTVASTPRILVRSLKGCSSQPTMRVLEQGKNRLILQHQIPPTRIIQQASSPAASIMVQQHSFVHAEIGEIRSI